MDMCMVEIGDHPCAVGDEVVVFGSAPSLAQYASDLGTIPYEALTSISTRVKRVHLHG
jgi:alanine racemase